MGNSAGEWDSFDPSEYHRTNYAALRDDDRQIIEAVRDFFAVFAAEAAVNRPLSGLDVGSGSNLYPALTLLPWCNEITMMEYSASNVAWLREEIKSYGTTWDSFWEVLRRDPAYAAVDDPRRVLATRATVRQGSVFELDQNRWDLGTMFFVACSISGFREDFAQALECFLNALVPRAPFAMAFMEKSHGYRVGDISFPAVSIGMEEISKILDGVVSDLDVDRIFGAELLREGYEAMILVRGRTRARPVNSRISVEV
ncbi:methyltransferase [Frankia sp. CcI49]|uniref:SCO2525 family SAM-dependent methyltransferase n=1 Tax=Frankia sp. CcI49 TaxID=1745382 RepID=UPI0009776F55|nr:SCO2525 family SAM-dependent methyltransferase [Frankia sp. CcI49]ONH60969.1 methyltransferase [Frankia sp. CcI49]